MWKQVQMQGWKHISDIVRGSCSMFAAFAINIDLNITGIIPLTYVNRWPSCKKQGLKKSQGDFTVVNRKSKSVHDVTLVNG